MSIEDPSVSAKLAAQAEEIRRLSKKIAGQARQIDIQRCALEEKNRELDAMHYVWCDGGCETGVHRYDGKGFDAIDQGLLARAIRNVERLGRKLHIKVHRAATMNADEALRRSNENAWGQVQKFATRRMLEQARAARWKRLAKRLRGERDKAEASLPRSPT